MLLLFLNENGNRDLKGEHEEARMQWWEGFFSRRYMSPEIIPQLACLGAYELVWCYHNAILSHPLLLKLVRKSIQRVLLDYQNHDHDLYCRGGSGRRISQVTWTATVLVCPSSPSTYESFKVSKRSDPVITHDAVDSSEERGRWVEQEEVGLSWLHLYFLQASKVGNICWVEPEWFSIKLDDSWNLSIVQQKLWWFPPPCKKSWIWIQALNEIQMYTVNTQAFIGDAPPLFSEKRPKQPILW